METEALPLSWHYIVLFLAVRRLLGARPLAYHRLGPLPAVLLSSLRPLVSSLPLTEVIAPARAAAGMVAPPRGSLWQRWQPNVAVILHPWTRTISMWPGLAPSASRPPALAS
jgi:hypothetical protein